MYTRKCAANIIEKYEHGLVVGYQRFAPRNNVNSFKKSVTYSISKNILRAHRENVHANFHCGVCATLIFCYKMASVA